MGAGTVKDELERIMTITTKRKRKMREEIKTARLLLRRFRESDYDDLFEFLSQLEDDEFEGYPGITYENGREHLRQRLGSEAFYAVVLHDSGKVIGNIYCGARDFAAKEVGYIINKDYQRQGYAGEALSAVIYNAFQEGAHRIYAECDPRNTPSWKLLESVGFRCEALLRQNIYFRKDADGVPIWKDTCVYAILEGDKTNKLRRDCQRRGYAKEAAKAVLDWAFRNTDYSALYLYCKYTNEPSIRTAESIGMHFDCDYPDEANGITHVSVISKEDWLSEIGAEVINQQKEGLQDGV